MKRLALLLIICLVCSLVGLWSPWVYWDIDFARIFGVTKPASIAGLQVFSLAGELEIYLDSKIIGTVTAENSPFIYDTVEPGERLIAIKRKTDVKNSYWDFTKLIKFEENTTAVISYNFGPEEEISEGHIIYAARKENPEEQSEIHLNVNTPNASIQIDTISVESISGNDYTSKISFDAQKVIKISKLGYETLEFTVLPESQEERDKLKDFDIVVEAHLMYQPVEI